MKTGIALRIQTPFLDLGLMVQSPNPIPRNRIVDIYIYIIPFLEHIWILRVVQQFQHSPPLNLHFYELLPPSMLPLIKASACHVSCTYSFASSSVKQREVTKLGKESPGG